LGLLLVAGGCSRAASSPPTNSTPTNSTAPQAAAVQPKPGAAAQPAANAAAASPAAGPDLAQAPAKPVSGEKPLPPNVRTSGPVADIIKLANSGVDQGVLTAFIANSTSAFNLSADEIIYLNDLGVPSSVVAAALQHDQTLKGVSDAGGENTQTAPAGAAPQQFAPAPAEPAPLAPAQAGPTVAETAPPPEAAPPPPAEVSQQDFYGSLSPYGTWVDVEGCGRCWQPAAIVVNPGWQPYLDGGHWVYTDCGWYWQSDYSWGWAPFHYGRWFRHNRLGWCWAPDTVWGPSWVCWRYGDDCCGWAPLPPGAWYRPGIGIEFRGRNVGLSFDFGLGVDCFAFVGWGHFDDHHLRYHAWPHDRVEGVFHHTVVTAGVTGERHGVFNHGPPPQRIASATHNEIRQIAVRDAGASHGRSAPNGQPAHEGRTLSVYHPTGQQPARGEPSAGRDVRTPTVSHTETPTRQPGVATPSRAGQNTASHIQGAGVASSPVNVRQPSAAPASAPGVQNRPGVSAAAPRQSTAPSYQAPVRPVQAPAQTQTPRYTPAPAQTPRYNPAPAQTPHYTPAPAQAPHYTPAPAQTPRYTPAPAQTPRYTPAPAVAPQPSRNEVQASPSSPSMEQRPAASAPASHGSASSSQGSRGR
jgi:hypothetical protein